MAAATDRRQMETFLGNTKENRTEEDSSGRKNSKLKSLKLRLFGKTKKEGETSRKLSQSVDDITVEELGSNEDLMCNPGAMGSRALSHDSIFLAEQALTEAEPNRVLSQENVHVKIKEIQEKLQQQRFYLGPPTMIPPTKLSEDQSNSEQERVCSQSEMTKALSQMSSNPVLPTSKPVPTKPKGTCPVEEAPLDFSSPPHFAPMLDTSAARHRLSVKPPNQRASSKKRHSTVDVTALTSNLNDSETLKEELEPPDVQEEPESQAVNIKMNESTSVLPEATKPDAPSKSSGDVPPQEDGSLLGKMPKVSTQILRPKTHRPVDVTPRPHSSFIPSEAKGKTDSSGTFDVQFLRDTQNKTWAMKSEVMSANQAPASPEIAVHPKVMEMGKTLAIKRPLPGSGSFHLSASKRKEDEERPRSGSFTGVREHNRIKTGGKSLETSPNISPRVDFKPENLVMGREETWMIKNSLRKVESVRNKVTDASDRSDAAKEASEEEEAKTTFGVKLRSTSQSVRLRPETASDECLKSAMTEEKNKHKQDSSNNSDPSCTKALAAEVKQADATGPSTQTPAPLNTPLVSAEVQPSQAKGSQPQAPSTEVTWMSMAMEKTKSLQNLFTSKFPKDLPGRQTAVSSQKMQFETTQPTQMQTQDAKNANQPLPYSAKTEALEHQPPAQTVKQLPPTTSTTQHNTSASFSREAQTTKPTVSTEPVNHSVVQGNIWTSQSPLRSVRQLESSSQRGISSTHGTPQTHLCSARGLRSTAQAHENTTESKTSTDNVEEMEGQFVWSRSVSKKAAFLEKRAGWASSPVELKSETLVSKEGKEESKHTVSTPKKIPGRPEEEKSIQKTVKCSSAPSPSPLSSTLQSMSDSGELSWIELAKRKSMAWSDKTMD